MALLTIQFWTLVDLAGPILVILIAQFLLALAINLLLRWNQPGSAGRDASRSRPRHSERTRAVT